MKLINNTNSLRQRSSYFVKSEKRGEERKRKVKVKTAAHTRTSQADILHLDQKATKCMTCKWVCGMF